MPGFTHHLDGSPLSPADCPDIHTVDGDGRVIPEAWIEEARTASANARIARTLALLDYDPEQACDAAEPEPGADYSGLLASAHALHDHGAPDAVPPSVRRIAALLGCSTEAAAYVDALETRVAVLEQKVSELRYDVRRVRRAA